MAGSFPITSAARYARLPAKGKATFSRVLDAIDLMVDDTTLTREQAARQAGTTGRTIDRYASSAFERQARRYRLRPNDRLFRSETMPMLVPPGDRLLPAGGVLDVQPTTRRQRSLIGRYWGDYVQQVADEQQADSGPFRHQSTAGHRFELDPHRIRQRYGAGELDVVVEVSPRV
jgi:hypothetical protein